MCGRYEIVDGKRIFTRFRVPTQYASLFEDNRDIRPTNTVPTIVTDHALRVMRWGLVPAWAKDPKIGGKMFNARAETVAEKPSFKKALRFQRCIIPASAFFEWKGAPGARVKQRIAAIQPRPAFLRPLQLALMGWREQDGVLILLTRLSPRETR